MYGNGHKGTIIEVPEACPYGQANPRACYYSKCKDGVWHGNDTCWNAQCLAWQCDDDCQCQQNTSNAQ